MHCKLLNFRYNAAKLTIEQVFRTGASIPMGQGEHVRTIFQK